MLPMYMATALLLISSVNSENSTAWVSSARDTCALQPWDEGPWGALLEEWATTDSGHHERQGRILAVPLSPGYYISDRLERPLQPPPPPPHHGQHSPPHGSLPQYLGPPQQHTGPPQQHAGPPQQHAGPPQQYAGPLQPHASLPQQYPGPTQQHASPPQQHAGAPQQHAGPAQQYVGPPQQYAGPPQQYAGPPHQYPGSSHRPPVPPSHGGPPMQAYDEWQTTPPSPQGASKILNRPPNPYKDKFKPGYPPPSHNQAIQMHGSHGPPQGGHGQALGQGQVQSQGHGQGLAQGQGQGQGLADRVDEARPSPQKQVSETDLFLLSAIEKLVYRVDLMEKRLRKMEENVHYIVAGAEAKPESCEANFTRVGEGCYHFSTDAVNWKSASYACRKLRANLLELDDDERRRFVSGVLADKRHKGFDFWTGGLNPGLLWIWSHSAKAVIANSTDSSQPQSATIVGEGRCLALVHDPAAAGYVYRGQDCSLRHRYVCEREDKDKLGNEIERVARKLRDGKRKAKILWTDDE